MDLLRADLHERRMKDRFEAGRAQLPRPSVGSCSKPTVLSDDADDGYPRPFRRSLPIERDDQGGVRFRALNSSRPPIERHERPSGCSPSIQIRLSHHVVSSQTRVVGSGAPRRRSGAAMTLRSVRLFNTRCRPRSMQHGSMKTDPLNAKDLFGRDVRYDVPNLTLGLSSAPSSTNTPCCS